MVHKGVGYRTPRTQAMKLGTSAKGFEGALPYDAQSGIPASMAAGQYKDFAEDAKASPSQIKPSVASGLPFALK